MRPANPFSDLAIGDLFKTLLPDLILAFAFFTALAYAVLGKRFDRQRPAIVMSAVIGMSLSRNLGTLGLLKKPPVIFSCCLSEGCHLCGGESSDW